jgi:hypothetical protein
MKQFYFPEQIFSFLWHLVESFKFESLDLYIFILWLLKLLYGLTATGTSLNITYEIQSSLDLEFFRLIRILNNLDAWYLSLQCPIPPISSART